MQKMPLDIIKCIFEQIWNTYSSAMQEQISIIVSILTALLTGGFLMLFIENQHLGAKVTENYHAIMDPFMKRFSGYVRFISSVRTWYVVNRGVDNDSYAIDFKNLLDKLGREGGKSIMSGRDIPIGHYSPEEFTDICDTMNHVWYCWDDKQNYMDKDFTFETEKANHFDQMSRQYLAEAMPDLKDKEISVPLIADVSGKMYCNLYQPIEDYPYEYRGWQQKEKQFNKLTVSIIFVNLVILVLILVCRYILPVWIFTVLTLASILLLVYAIFKLLELIGLSKCLFR